MGVLALLLMLATPSFAQRDFRGISKTRKTSAIEQFSMRGEVMKKHPALARMQSSLKDRGNVFKNTVVGKIKAKRDAELLAGDNGPMMTGTLIYDERLKDGMIDTDEIVKGNPTVIIYSENFAKPKAVVIYNNYDYRVINFDVVEEREKYFDPIFKDKDVKDIFFVDKRKKCEFDEWI